MKKLLTMAAIAFFVLASCDNLDNDPGQTPGSDTATLTIRNMTFSQITNVIWEGVDFSTIGVGQTVTRTVTPGTGFIFFNRAIDPFSLNARTVTVHTVAAGEATDFAFFDSTLIMDTNPANPRPTGRFDTLGVNIAARLRLRHDDIYVASNTITPPDFGRVNIGNNASLVFTIRNSGNIPLELNAPLISSNAAFTILFQPAMSIAPGATTTFGVQFAPTAEGQSSAAINIFSNCEDHAIFTLNVRGEGHVPRPQITVRQEATAIAPNGEVDFGARQVGETHDIVFTIGNTGEAPLTFNADVNDAVVILTENTSGHFSVTQQPFAAAQLAPGASTNFTIRFAPVVTGGPWSANVRISTNSREYGNFIFRVTGRLAAPSVPSGVTVVADSSNSILIQWNAVPGADFYRVQFATAFSGTFSDIPGASSVMGTSATHSGLPHGVTRWYRVSAVNSVGESNFSTPIPATIRPAAPSPVAAFAVSASQIRVSWNTVTGATGYRLERAATDGGAWELVANVGVASNQVNISGIAANTTHWFRVFALNSAGDSEPSATVSATTLAPLVIGSTGPGGGTVFFVQGTQVLEVSGELGMGIWSAANNTTRGFSGGGFDNWRLPTSSELELIHENLHRNGLGGFMAALYWSSATDNFNNRATAQNFSSTALTVQESVSPPRDITVPSGGQAWVHQNNSLRFRAVRSFVW